MVLLHHVCERQEVAKLSQSGQQRASPERVACQTGAKKRRPRLLEAEYIAESWISDKTLPVPPLKSQPQEDPRHPASGSAFRIRVTQAG